MSERAVPVLPADDLGVAKAFYVGLGFAVEWESSEDGRTGIMGLKRGGIELTIESSVRCGRSRRRTRRT